MSSRWREENYFRYGRTHFALDALDSYAAIAEDPGRMVPNPAKKTAAARVHHAATAISAAGASRRQPARTAQSRPRPLRPRHQPAGQRAQRPHPGRLDELEAAQAAATAIPAQIPLGEHNPNMVQLDTETKQITHAIRMAAYNTETILARALNSHYARAGDEAYALIREALHTSGDITHPRPAAHPARPAHRTPPHPRAGRPLRTAQQTRALSRHPSPPALRSQRTPRHYMNYCAMSGALGLDTQTPPRSPAQGQTTACHTGKPQVRTPLRSDKP